MSKPWKPARETVTLRPSRIRREPVRTETVVKPPPSREREIWSAVAGVVLIAAGCAALAIGVSEVTSYDSPAAASAGSAERFGYCNSGGGPDCVEDGDTFFIAGEKIGIAGIDAPQVNGRCREESRRGIQAAVRLHALLNRGTVTLIKEGPDRDSGGRLLRKVDVAGLDAGAAMVGGGYARTASPNPQGWCG